MKIIIVSGSSGSGKSISLHLLEDLGYYCIDNLPASLINTLIDHLQGSYQKIAIGIDARNLPQDLDKFHHVIENFKKRNVDCEIIYLDAEDSTLFKRFNETRRKHPLSNQNTSLIEAISKEKILLAPIAHLADLRIDTTRFTIHQLRDVISTRINQKDAHLSLLLQSFGYKFGAPLDSDFVFDVRCLPNPYWHQELRPFTGQDKPVQDFLNKSEDTAKMIEDITELLKNWIPRFEASNRSYMTISIGCTGGQHRSVYVCEKIKNHLDQLYSNIQMRHRELQ